jgi:hypothetical protein
MMWAWRVAGAAKVDAAEGIPKIPGTPRFSSNSQERSGWLADKQFVSEFFRRAEEILQIATTGNAGAGDTALVLDRQGGLRMLDPSGWSLPALAAEYGAQAVYRVIRRGNSVRVEGWNGFERCLLEAQPAATCLSRALAPAAGRLSTDMASFFMAADTSAVSPFQRARLGLAPA